MLNTSMFKPHLLAVLNDQECPLLLHHLNNASMSLTTRNLIHEMSCQSPWNIFAYFFFENHEVRPFFLNAQRFTEIFLGVDLTGKVSPKFMSANAESVRFKLACNVHVWAYFEKIAFSGKPFFFLFFLQKKNAYGFGQDISCIIFHVVSDF